MKIFSSSQVRQWEAITLQEQGIPSLALMERAAHACFRWLIEHELTLLPIHLFCGKGNNGGDGLALARMLMENKIPATVYILESGKAGSGDFQENLQQLHQLNANLHYIQSADFFPAISNKELVIDALFGTGLNKPLDDTAGRLAAHLNSSGAMIVSVDIPSGLYADKSSKGNIVVEASYTLSFQQYKMAFLFPENSRFTGEIHILPIGLSSHFEEKEPCPVELTDIDLVKKLVPERNPFSHKGNFGHAALAAGSIGMMGAAVLAAKGCLCSGAGKLTSHVPACGYTIMQATVPEAMCNIAGENTLQEYFTTEGFGCLAIGPGIGTSRETGKWLQKMMLSVKIPLVLDADALNILAADPEFISLVPPGTLITPHPKEFDRLFGSTENDFERLGLAITKAAALNIYIVLKGHFTAIITPMRKVYFNSTGNSGMAKGGMGDALTGIITGLIAQKLLLPEAAILGVYLHGLAGDFAAEKFTRQAMQATDLLECMADAWKKLENE